MSDGVIETKNLSVYYGKHRGIKDVNLSVEQGEVFGFLGPNGAGKTTTQRVLMDVIRPTNGSAFIFGRNCRKQRAAILFFGLALLGFQRHNVTVGAWPWQRSTISE